MKPNFALLLSFDGIGLLHRTHAGWHLVGEVSLDSDNLASDLAELAGKARSLDPTGLRCKLVIPPEQIKYLAFDSAATDGDTIEREVRAALDGATPYTLAELSYDWSLREGRVHVAAVARETLEEAESFAVSHEFNPMCFVAMPEEDAFAGEPFFAETRHAGKVLGRDETVAREADVIRIVGAAHLPEPEPVAEQDAPGPDAPAPEPEPPREPETAKETPSPAASPPPEKRPSKGRKNRKNRKQSNATGKPGAAAESAKTGQATAPAPAFTSVRSAWGGDTAASAPPGGAASGWPALPKARFSPPPLTAEAPAATSAPPDVSGVASGELPGDTPVRKRRTKRAPGAGRQAPPAPVPGPPPDIPATGADEVAAAPPPDARTDGSVAAFLRRNIPGRGQKRGWRRAGRESGAARRQDAPTAPAAALTVDAALDEKDRMTIFGARGNGGIEPDRPRYLALMLTVLLLLALVAVAVWASLRMDNGLSRLFLGAPQEVEIAAEPEAITAPPPTGATLPDEPRDEAALAPETTDEPAQPEAPEAQADAGIAPEAETATAQDTTDDATAQDAATGNAQVQDADTQQDDGGDIIRPEIIPEVLTPEQARRRYAATGIWQMAPEPSPTPGETTLREVYQTTLDPPVDVGDAVALPEAEAFQYQARPSRPGNPPSPLARFELDERGFIAATPEGTETPDGVMIYAGSPPLEPPPTPPRAAPEVLDDPTAAAPAEPILRPRLRPDDLSAIHERNTLGGRTRTELAGLRPQLRPRSAQELAADTTGTGGGIDRDAPLAGATEEAVAVSLVPRARPERFAAIVSEARATATDPVSADQRMSAAEPTAVSVARAATEKNRIALRKVSLIGVYGSPDSRRALVRMASGRYRKVEVGDRLDGGRVAAIGEDELRYVKNGRPVVLKMPKG